MEQYLTLLKQIKERGTLKPAARPGMPGTISLFGYQFRHDLSKGFPLLTTKKMFWKGIVNELLWFLRGDTNIKFLVDKGINIWNGDAYNYYVKKCKEHDIPLSIDRDSFDAIVQDGKLESSAVPDYRFGDCGFQYGKVWRDWGGLMVDQISNVIKSLKEMPESRRHIVTAIDPAHETDLALYWCHAMFQLNCRPVGDEIYEAAGVMYDDWRGDKNVTKEQLWEMGYPKYYLDCQLYQRSADVFLGVPFNIASYALLTHLFAEICNMLPGEFIHTFGDVHIYENHMDAVNKQLTRTPHLLPSLKVFPKHPDHGTLPDHFEKYLTGRISIENLLSSLSMYDFRLSGYNPQPQIKAELSTGTIK